MDTAVRVVITLLLIGLVVLGIVFFAIFFVVPAERFVKVRAPGATSTEAVPEFTGVVPPGGLTLEEIQEFIKSQLPPQPIAVPPPPVNGGAPAPSGPAIPGNYRPNPLTSVPIASDEVPSGFLVLEVGTSGYRPRAFEVRAGSQVNLAIAARDGESHLFVFQHPGLADIAVGVGPGQTRTITFTAPPVAGEYLFQCGVPGHAARGEIGTMVVR